MPEVTKTQLTNHIQHLCILSVVYGNILELQEVPGLNMICKSIIEFWKKLQK